MLGPWPPVVGSDTLVVFLVHDREERCFRVWWAERDEAGRRVGRRSLLPRPHIGAVAPPCKPLLSPQQSGQSSAAERWDCRHRSAVQYAEAGFRAYLVWGSMRKFVGSDYRKSVVTCKFCHLPAFFQKIFWVNIQTVSVSPLNESAVIGGVCDVKVTFDGTLWIAPR
jgi:hypothetical protein